MTSPFGQKELQWNNGENIGSADLNNMQRFHRAQVTDQLLAAIGGFSRMSGSGVSDLNRTAHAWVMSDSCAPFNDGVTPLKVNSLAGPVIQWRTGAPGNLHGTAMPADWGDDPYALLYWADLHEFASTHAIGGANPRWDTVSLQLSTINNDPADLETRIERTLVGGVYVLTSVPFSKRRKVKARITITKGAEGATPNPPTPPAGDVPLWAVYVPAGYNATFDPTMIWDFRMPLGQKIVDVRALDVRAQLTGIALAHLGASTAFPGVFGAVGANDAAAELWFTPDGVNHSHRLVAVEALIGTGNTTANFYITRASSFTLGELVPVNPSVAPGPVGLSNLNAGLRGTTSTTDHTKWLIQQLGMSAFLNDGSHFQSMPIWGNGRPGGYNFSPERASTGTEDIAENVCVRYQANDTTAMISKLRFHFAGGI